MKRKGGRRRRRQGETPRHDAEERVAFYGSLKPGGAKCHTLLPPVRLSKNRHPWCWAGTVVGFATGSWIWTHQRTNHQ